VASSRAPNHRLGAQGNFELPSIEVLLRELRIIVAEASPSDAIFGSNHASNHLPIGGRLPRDREAIIQQVDTTVARAASSLGVTAPTASKTIRELERAGLLKEVTGREWGRFWLAEPILNALATPPDSTNGGAA
jgi:hypothetical protein